MIHFSSATDQWATPTSVFDSICTAIGVVPTFDAAADASNTKAPAFFTIEDNALVQTWPNAHVWLNPPYGRTLLQWARKAVQEVRRPDGPPSITILVPARTDTRWWLHLVTSGHAQRVMFVHGRIRFGDGTAAAPFPSAIIHLTRAPHARPSVDFRTEVNQ